MGRGPQGLFWASSPCWSQALSGPTMSSDTSAASNTSGFSHLTEKLRLFHEA